MYRELLGELAVEVRRYGGSLQAPCDERSIATLRVRVRAQLGIGLPAGLEDFLRLTDGLNWNGLYLYPSSTAALVGTRASF